MGGRVGVLGIVCYVVYTCVCFLMFRLCFFWVEFVEVDVGGVFIKVVLFLILECRLEDGCYVN